MDRYKLKKAELHLHLDGSLRPETVMELAKKDGIELSANNIDDVKKLLQVDEDNKDLVEYLKKFSLPIKLMQNKENIKRIAFELVEDLAKENYVYAEIRFAPQLHLEQGLSLEEVVESVKEGILEAECIYDIEVNILLCIMRHLAVEKSFEILELAEKFAGQKVVGIDLAGDEFNYSALLFKEVFNKALDRKIPFTIHAGEARGVESIREAIDCGAKRLGHGIRAFEDEELMRELKDKKISLECCPISNYNTQAIPDFYKYPLKKYIQEGLKACLNTDNRTVSNTNYIKELEFLDKFNPLNEEEIKMASKNAIEGAFIGEIRKLELLKKLDI